MASLISRPISMIGIKSEPVSPGRAHAVRDGGGGGQRERDTKTVQRATTTRLAPAALRPIAASISPDDQVGSLSLPFEADLDAQLGRGLELASSD